MSYKIIGRVTTKEDNKAIPGLKIEIWDKDLGNMDEYLGEAGTDELGEFKIEYTEEDFTHWGKDEKPDLYIVVINKHGEIIWNSEKAVRQDADKEEIFYIRIPKADIDKKGETDPKDRAAYIKKMLEG